MHTGLIARLGGLLLAIGAPVVEEAGPVVSRTCRLVWDVVVDTGCKKVAH
jgi:hypothetical protein